MNRLIRVLAGVTVACALAPAAASAEPFSIHTIHLSTLVGPNDDQHCDVIADLYKPADASPSHREPAVLMTNGFGGSKDDQAGIAKALASNGYVALSYSGLGFGGSGCKIELDSPQWDGKAASQLIDFLGGGRAATDGTTVNYVKLDRRAHDGRHYAHDPRVGMIGGSYGGQIQFAAAADDPRLDTIIPMITWNDLSYSIFPNNADISSGVTSSTPGVLKYIWGLLFTGEGSIIDGLQGAQADPSRDVGCPNFDDEVCAGLAASILGAPSAGMQALMHQASVSTYIDRIRIPTMLCQGQDDTLFNLNESVATYDALRARHVPVKLVWQSWGHSGGPAPGELDTSDPAKLQASYEGELAMRWFDYYLKNKGPRPKLDFSYFRDWVKYRGNDAGAAYASTRSYPAVPQPRKLYLSGTSGLVSVLGAVKAGIASLLTSPGSAPTSLSEISVVDNNYLHDPTPFDLPGMVTVYRTLPLQSDTDVVGVPTLHVRLSAPLGIATTAAGADGDLTMYVKLYDVGPGGSTELPDGLVAPARIADPRAPVDVQLPGIVHRFPAGHRLELVISGADLAYRGSPVTQLLSIIASPSNPSVLSLPVVSG